MAAEVESPEATTAIAAPRNRKPKNKKSKNPNKKIKKAPPAMGAAAKHKNPSKKMIKLFRKRAREYNSDDDDDEEQAATRARVSDAGALQDREDAASSGDSGEDEGKRVGGLLAMLRDDLVGGEAIGGRPKLLQPELGKPRHAVPISVAPILCNPHL